MPTNGLRTEPAGRDRVTTVTDACSTPARIDAASGARPPSRPAACRGRHGEHHAVHVQGAGRPRGSPRRRTPARRHRPAAGARRSPCSVGRLVHRLDGHPGAHGHATGPTSAAASSAGSRALPPSSDQKTGAGVSSGDGAGGGVRPGVGRTAEGADETARPAGPCRVREGGRRGRGRRRRRRGCRRPVGRRGARPPRGRGGIRRCRRPTGRRCRRVAPVGEDRGRDRPAPVRPAPGCRTGPWATPGWAPRG